VYTSRSNINQEKIIMAAPSRKWYKRRKLLQFAGVSTVAFILPGAIRAAINSPKASQSTPPVNPSATPNFVPHTVASASSNNPHRVVLVRANDRISGMRQAIDLFQPQGISGKTVFVKPNYNTADPAPAATDTKMLEALIQELQQAGAGQMTIGDRSGMAETRAAMQAKGVFQLADQYSMQALVFDELAANQWQSFPAAGTHWERGFAIARPVLDAGAVVSTCCLKTHRFGGHFTLSLKNTVGMVAKYIPGDSYNYMAELHSSPHQRLMIAEINKAYQPALVVLDGFEAFLNGGPESGKVAKPQVMLVGTDRIAIDAVAISILRSLGTTQEVSQGSIWQQEQIRHAANLGLGATSAEQIEIITADNASTQFANQIRKHLV
jgi:uncharacterized protein (DUF362 family)